MCTKNFRTVISVIVLDTEETVFWSHRNREFPCVNSPCLSCSQCERNDDDDGYEIVRYEKEECLTTTSTLAPTTTNVTTSTPTTSTPSTSTTTTSTTTAPSPCQAQDVSVEGMTFAHPIVPISLCVLPPVTVQQCHGTCESMSPTAIVSYVSILKKITCGS